jgi:hypothetical protein
LNRARVVRDENFRCGRSRRCQPGPSIFDGETLPDFIDPFVKCVEACVKTSVVKIKYVSHGQKSENPVVRFHVHQNQLNRVTDENNNVPQDVHRIPHFEKLKFQFWKILGLEDLGLEDPGLEDQGLEDRS